MKPYDNSGKILARLRLDENLTQREMGHKIRQSSQFVSNCERGLSFPPPRAMKWAAVNFPNRHQELRDLLDAYIADKAEQSNHYVGKLKRKMFE